MKKQVVNKKEENKKTLNSFEDQKVDANKVKGGKGGSLGGRALVD